MRGVFLLKNNDLAKKCSDICFTVARRMRTELATWTLRGTLAALLALVSTELSAATPNDAFALFDALCVGTDSDLKLVERMALAAGATPIPLDMLNLDRAIAQYGGSGFILTRGGSKYSVMVTPSRGCSILAVGISAAEVRRLLVTNYSLGKAVQDSSGTQVVTLWLVAAPSRHKGGVIMLNVPKLGFGADNALSIGFVPAAARQR